MAEAVARFLQTYGHMAVGWTWAMDTPFRWTKQIASHFGGIRQGVCMSWPAVIKDTGGIRHQFHEGHHRIRHNGTRVPADESFFEKRALRARNRRFCRHYGPSVRNQGLPTPASISTT